jgi:hypothetical protein
VRGEGGLRRSPPQLCEGEPCLAEVIIHFQELLSFFLMFNLSKKQNKERPPENLEEALVIFKNLEEEIKKLSARLEKFEKAEPCFFQKLGLVRFNPFKEMGGDQSFSLALLDKQNSGFIITSLNSRQGNRIFAKPLNKGFSSYQLSEEEERAIEQAKNF